MSKLYLIVAIGMATALFSCRHQPQSPDVVSGATIPHDQIVLPPTNNHYQVLGHREGLNGYIVKYDDSFYRGGQVYIEDLAEAHNLSLSRLLNKNNKEEKSSKSLGTSCFELQKKKNHVDYRNKEYQENI